MSESAQNITIQIASDPRDRPEFNAIRDEINKINHPAQPEVNWNLIESLALTLFRTQGVDLQTAVYYTLARSHKYQLAGFTEGCELLAALVVHHWDMLWPEQPQARIEILDWFNARVGNQLRQQRIEVDDIRLVYRAERALQLLCDKLQQVELKRVPRVENMLYLMQATAKRLEAVPEGIKKKRPESSTIPVMVYLPDVPKTVTNTIPLNFPEPQVSTSLCSDKSGQKPLSAGWGFACGVLMSLLAGALIYFLEVKPLQQQLATLAATPEGAVQLWLTKPERESYGQHLNRLENLPVAGVLQMADASLTIARQRWPGDPNQIQESQRWEQLLEARRGTPQARDSYFRVQQLLRALSAKLIEQEQQRGSLTISWLKTAVYEMQSEMNREVPLEELLRQLSISLQQKKTASPALLKQTDERWQALLSQYHQLMQRETPTH